MLSLFGSFKRCFAIVSMLAVTTLEICDSLTKAKTKLSERITCALRITVEF